MFGHGTKFPRKKEQAIAALLSQRTLEGAARVAGIGVKTLKRWLKNPEFHDEYRQARREVVLQTISLLQQNTHPAGMTILKLMSDPSVAAAIRFKASRFVVEISVNGITLEDLEERLTKLERAAEKLSGRK